MNTLYKFLPVLALGLSVASTHAAALIKNTGTCTLDSVVISTMTSSITTTPVPLPTGGISATKCFGVIDGNDEQGGTNSPSPNLGYLGDGLLNGGIIKEGNVKKYVDPGFFLGPGTGSDYLPLENPDEAVDPGWIMLGTLDQGLGKMNGYTITNGSNTLDIDDVLKFTMNLNGTWSLDIDKNIVTTLTNAGLFERSFFDQLAFVFKAGSGANDNEGGWAIYDFNFNVLLAANPGAFDLKQPYSFTGTWNTDDFDGKAISHMSLWARDPLNTTSVVPVPGTVLLLGIGLLGLGFVRRKVR